MIDENQLPEHSSAKHSIDREELRLAVYKSFASIGRAPDCLNLAAQFGTNEVTIVDGLQELALSRDLVIVGGNIVMAHPFAAIPLGFSVMSSTALWWGGCAWDSFAIPHLLPEEAPVLVATSCPNCERALAWNVGNEEPPTEDEVAHFLVPAAAMWEDVVHTCGNQRIFCSETCVDGWLERTGLERGYVMDLPTLWRLAAGWYSGRLTYGYVRREPSEAAQYLRDVGLDGAFWGL